MVDHDCDPTVVNNKGETALDLACRFGHLEVIIDFTSMFFPALKHHVTLTNIIPKRYTDNQLDRQTDNQLDR